MARSSYIYILWRFGIPNELVGAFTVLHEMKTYIKHNPDDYYAERYRDGNPKQQMTEVELT